jgi:hypothetical protein
VVRVNSTGSTQIEPRVAGTPVLLNRDRTLTVDRVLAAYESFMATAVPTGAPREVKLQESLRSFLEKRVVGRDRLDALLERISREHMEPAYHGDFWVGNILARASDGRLVLIDPERHPFGSRSLDGADFLLDFLLNARSGAFPAFDLKRFCAHFGIAPDDRQLLEVAIFRQVLWYSPAGRPYPLLFTHLEMLKELCSAGRLPEALLVGLRHAESAS